MFKRFLLRFAMLFLTLEIARAENLSHLMLNALHLYIQSRLAHSSALNQAGIRMRYRMMALNICLGSSEKPASQLLSEDFKGGHRYCKNADSNGHFVGIGLTQVNSQHLSRLGLTVEQLLDPCTNLRAGVWILTHFYIKALRQYKNPQSALLAAISAFNTGDFKSGFANGYVQKVMINAGITVPLLNITKPRRRLTTPASPAPSGHVNPRRQFLQAKFSKLEFE